MQDVGGVSCLIGINGSLNDGYAFHRNLRRRAQRCLVRPGRDRLAQQPTPAPQPTYKFEKCYGIVKSGKNDCATVTSSCAGTAKRDNQPDAWVYVPSGTCDKIVGGSATPKQS